MTPPEEPLPVLGLPCMSSMGSMGGGINPAGLGGSAMGLNTMNLCPDNFGGSSLQINQEQPGTSSSAAQSPQHLQGTIV